MLLFGVCSCTPRGKYGLLGEVFANAGKADEDLCNDAVADLGVASLSRIESKAVLCRAGFFFLSDLVRWGLLSLLIVILSNFEEKNNDNPLDWIHSYLYK